MKRMSYTPYYAWLHKAPTCRNCWEQTGTLFAYADLDKCPDCETRLSVVDDKWFKEEIRKVAK